MEEGSSGSGSQGHRRVPISHFTPPGPLKVRGDLAQHWREWRQIWDAYETVVGLRDESDDYRIAVFIQSIGQPALKVFNALRYDNEGDKKKMDKVLEAMERHCLGKTNVIFHRFTFNNRSQKSGETFDAYLTDLEDLVSRCSFQAMENPAEQLLRDRIVCGIQDDGLRKQLLSRTDLSLAECIDLCRATEASTQQVREMAGDDKVHAVKKNSQSERSKVSSRKQKETKCENCGWYHGSSSGECRAADKLCLRCGEVGHYKRMCRGEAKVAQKKKKAKKKRKKKK